MKKQYASTVNLNRICIGLIIISFSSCRSSQSFTTLDLSPSTLNSIDSLCKLNLEKENYPGLAIAVAEKGKRIWSKGYGYSNMETKRPIDADDDLFRIGSISKTVTAAALARMIEKKELNLDEPISNYYQKCPEDKRSITSRQLGGHTAGIRHYNGLEFLSAIHYHKVEDALEVFIHDTLLFIPGTKYSYSTYGWTLLSLVMEEAVHKPITDIIQQEVGTLLHLPDLKPDQVDSTHFHRVQFYEFQTDQHTVSPPVDISNKWSGGGYLCSAEDLAKFGFAFTSPGFLKPETLEEFTSSQTLPDGKKTNYGIGFRSNKDKDGKLWYGHSGGSIGGTSMLVIYPEEDLVVVTLINLTGADMNDLAMEIAHIIRTGHQ